MEWISVEDRLPESLGYDEFLGMNIYPWVLAFLPDEYVRFGICAYDTDNDDWFFADYSEAGLKVTHWMPLPAPPQ